VTVATHFHDALGLTGLILTKLDGDARGGAALSLREVTQQPIKFAGVGEKIDQCEPFHPERMAGRILGMGDVVGLVERAAEAIDVERSGPTRRKNCEPLRSIFTIFLPSSRCCVGWDLWKIFLHAPWDE